MLALWDSMGVKLNNCQAGKKKLATEAGIPGRA
jgi:hypothetical protein